ncbi:uncharacterized protein LOC125473022 [Pyrus x bretschneideri]|uniref:uncharacterized protein LOC125473022 n=1 Tax=Pyrus x bretschneideri TaxID=225117 RepID=UPI00202E0D3C|nr:uncharacterized protein LOC125473022 [Pyrus x bretschneideri]
MAAKHHVIRSISLPSRSHPTTLRVEEELNRLQTSSSCDSTSDSICKSLCGLDELYECVDDLLQMASTQQLLSHELLDGALMRLLDICDITGDAISTIKEHVRDLQSALRRRKGDSSLESSISKYTCFRKKMNKDAKKLITSLKQVDNKIATSPLLEQDHHLTAVIRVLREVRVKNMSIFQSLLVLQHRLDAALYNLCKSSTATFECANKRLEALEVTIEGLENGLESVFRRMIKTRASLLNIISQ